MHNTLKVFLLIASLQVKIYSLMDVKCKCLSKNEFYQSKIVMFNKIIISLNSFQ